MKTKDFNKNLTSSSLQENIAKQFNVNVNFDKYNREQLEDIRNKLRTKVFQQEEVSKINELLTNETYQKDKAMLQLLNTRIKEMLGEDIKKLKDKMIELSEGKKGVRAPKYHKKAKGSEGGKGTIKAVGSYKKANKDWDGDGKIESPKDEVWGSRMKAAKKAGKMKENQEELDEKWGTTTTVSSAEKGKYKGKTVADLKKSLASIKKSGPHEKGSTEYNRMKELQFAIRAKTGWGKVREQEDMDETASDENVDTSKVGHDQAERRIKGVKKSTRTGHTTGTGKGYVHKKKFAGHDTDDKDLDEASKPSSGLSAKKKSATVKKAKAGGDIGKPGKGFEKVASKATKKYGSKEKGEKVAAAAMWKSIKRENQETFRQNVRIVNEGLARLLKEDEEGKAKAITAASDIVNDFTSWMQRVGQYQTKAMIELADSIRADFGATEAETFKQSVAPALASTLETLTQQREAISNAVAVLAGEEVIQSPMGAEPGAMPGPEVSGEPGIEPTGPDEMNPPSDEFGASDAAAGGEESTGRELRETRAEKMARKLAESHSLISKLSR